MSKGARSMTETGGEGPSQHEGEEVTRKGCVSHGDTFVTFRGKRADSNRLPPWPLRPNLVICS